MIKNHIDKNALTDSFYLFSMYQKVYPYNFANDISFYIKIRLYALLKSKQSYTLFINSIKLLQLIYCCLLIAV